MFIYHIVIIIWDINSPVLVREWLIVGGSILYIKGKKRAVIRLL